MTQTREIAKIDFSETETDYDEEEDEEKWTAEEEMEFENEDMDNLINKNSDSFRCLVQLIVSHSSIFRDPFYVFPPLKDPELDITINYVPSAPTIDDVGCEMYKRLCKEFKIVPLSRVLKSLPTKILNLKYYGLTHKQIEAIMSTLANNEHIEQLNLQDSWLEPQSVQCISKMLSENNKIQYLNLQGCRIGPKGAEELTVGISSSNSLHYLNLAFNKLGDDGMVALGRGFKNNPIVQLDLSHNMLGEGASEVLRDILMGSSRNLEDLNLSWNDFYTVQSMKNLGDGLPYSRLKSLNLAWNAISAKECTKPIGKFVRDSTTMQFLDMSNNRLTGAALTGIRTSMKKSKTLLALKLGNNPIKPKEALRIGKALATSKSCRFVDLENIFVEKDFIRVWNKIKQAEKVINFGGICSNYNIQGPDELKLLFERCKFLSMKAKNPKKQKDFAWVVFDLKDKPYTHEDFKKFIKKQQVKEIYKDKDLLKQLMERFTEAKQINAVKLKETYSQYYPDAKPKPKKPKKGKKKRKKKQEETDKEATETGTEITTETGTQVTETGTEVTETGTEVTETGTGVTEHIEETLSGKIIQEDMVDPTREAVLGQLEVSEEEGTQETEAVLPAQNEPVQQDEEAASQEGEGQQAVSQKAEPEAPAEEPSKPPSRGGQEHTKTS